MTNENDIILIDTSYVIYYRFYATIKWYSSIYCEEYNCIDNVKTYDWSINTIFMKSYTNSINTFLTKLFDKSKLKKSLIVFALDSNKLNNWKYKLYDCYKSTRVKKDNLDKIFEYTINNILPKYNELKFINTYKIIKIDYLEADDIIAIITLNNITSNIYIVSDDSDFLQLGSDYVTFINLRCCYKKITKEKAIECLKSKIIYGDKSDNIPSIFKRGYKIKKADLMIDEVCEEYFKRNENAKTQYLLNKSLIDFNEIPHEYHNSVLYELNT